jgi:hypothetical protein
MITECGFVNKLKAYVDPSSFWFDSINVMPSAQVRVPTYIFPMWLPSQKDFHIYWKVLEYKKQDVKKNLKKTLGK